MIISIDFDQTIAVDEFPNVGPAVPCAIKTITSLHRDGHTLILFTCREGQALDNACEWMEEQGLLDLFAGINEWPQCQIDKWGSDPRKIVGDVNIDDRNVGVPCIDFGGVRVVDWISVDNLIYLMVRGVI